MKQAQEYKGYLGRKEGLEIHMQCNFYPPISSSTRTVMREEFEKHWKDKCHPLMLLQRINRRLKTGQGPEKEILSLDRFYEFTLSEGEIVGSPPKRKNPWVFPKAKVERIARSIRNIFEKSSMAELTKEAYDFVNQLPHFIAHYNFSGFAAYYENSLRQFAEDILYGLEDGCKHADYISGTWFVEKYGKEYCEGEAQTMRKIFKSAERFLKNYN